MKKVLFLVLYVNVVSFMLRSNGRAHALKDIDKLLEITKQIVKNEQNFAFDYHAQIVYSQNGSDLILRSLFYTLKELWYVHNINIWHL